ncbi:hypothetical protein SAMN02745975_03616 [Geosporobacter subterraneus DSM 17957]|uniref:Uncharacterized protein n=1 Tax=Geosporobacter subterraneus DSM 17957 TaxID=1121919 RepID=A0A1M6PM91_9FIRM|nr:hypothetical protein SAMN02745975_03616 [Geosporobacter subterraneus DSM 17957]
MNTQNDEGVDPYIPIKVYVVNGPCAVPKKGQEQGLCYKNIFACNDVYLYT